MKKITLIIPAYNEEAVLPRLFERLATLQSDVSTCHFEFLFVDDGSTDRTRELIAIEQTQNKSIQYIGLSRNFGKEAAMLAGFDHATGDAVVIIDADLQDPPELIPQMITFWQEGYDDVYARRRSRTGETWLKKKTSEWYYKILQKSTRIPIQRDTGDFRLLDRRCVESLRSLRESQRNTKALFSWIGYRKKELLYDRDPRVAGETKWNYRKLLNLAVDGITSFTTAPLRLSSVLGVVISVCAFIYILYLLIRPIFGVPTGAGYSSLMAVILFLGGIQLLSLGIIGEYIARIFAETKQRPPYLIAEHHRADRKKHEK